MNLRKINIINLVLIIYILCAIITDDGTPIMQIGRLILIGTFVMLIIKKHKWRMNIYSLWLFLFWMFATVSIEWSQNKVFALAMSKTLFINMLCMYALLYLIDYRRDRMYVVLKTCIYAPVMLEIRVIVSGGLFAFADSNVRAVGGISGNTLGLCAAFGACIAIYFIMVKENRYLYTLLFLINLIVVILSSSRKALFCVCIPVLFVYIFNHKDSFMKTIRKLLIALLLIVILYVAIINIPILYNMVGNRIESMIAMLLGNTSGADSSSVIRFRLISWGMEWYKKKPLLGYGIDNYRAVLMVYHPDYPSSYYAHNNYVELLVDVGIIGLIMYYWNYILMFIRGIKYRNKITNYEILFLGMLVALMVNEYGLVSYYNKYIQILLLIIWIIMDVLKSSIKDIQITHIV